MTPPVGSAWHCMPRGAIVRLVASWVSMFWMASASLSGALEDVYKSSIKC